METFCQEAIILKTYPFKDRQYIVAALTKEIGLIRMLVTCSKASPCPDPLTEVECILVRGSSDLFRCKELTPLYHHLSLRQSYPLLDLALRMALMLLQLQPAEDSASGLYRLLSIFLRQLPHNVKYLIQMEACFVIKLLKHEGVLTALSHCSICGSRENLSLNHFELFCLYHCPTGSLAMSRSDIKTFNALFFVSSFQQLSTIDMEKNFIQKTQKLLETYSKK